MTIVSFIGVGYATLVFAGVGAFFALRTLKAEVGNEHR